MTGAITAKRIMRSVAIILYFGLARHLPISYSPLSFGLTKPFREILCRFIFTECGKNVTVERGASFGYNVKIGNNSAIGVDAKLHPGTAGITIGNNVMMGPEVVIMATGHRHDDITRPIGEQGYEPDRPVIIEDDVWIGMRVIILPGVTIGRASIIGAGAVVTKDVPPLSVAVGNPARVVKRRDA